MSHDIWVAFVNLADHVLVAVIQTSPFWLTAAAVLTIAVLYRDPLSEKLRSASRVALGGFELEVAGAALTTARPDAPVPGLVARSLVRRTREHAEDLAGLRILWVDDNPEGNSHERRFLRAAGVTVVNALDTGSALRELALDDYDLVITDFARGGSATEGIDFCREARAAGNDQPFVAYIGKVDPQLGTPEGFVKVVDRPDDLIGTILDLAEARAT